MDLDQLKARLPGYIATWLLIISTILWTLFGLYQMFYQWGTDLPPLWLYMLPAVFSFGLSLFSFTHPRTGGWLLISLGILIAVWWSVMAGGRARMMFSFIITILPVVTFMVITGVFLLLDARYRESQRGLEAPPQRSWYRRYWRQIIILSIPILVVITILVLFIFANLTTTIVQDPADYPLIEGNGVTLVWAPDGPGWNMKMNDSAYPHWVGIALYGLEPTGFMVKSGYESKYPDSRDLARSGLCRYLTPEGKKLRPQSRKIWRLPTVDEIVRSLVSGGQNAGCVWDGQPGKADCELPPDRSMPLWAPDEPPIYYWAADEYDDVNAWNVSYNGEVHFQPKEWTNLNHGFRCVRSP